jgi:hypothetical protein
LRVQCTLKPRRLDPRKALAESLTLYLMADRIHALPGVAAVAEGYPHGPRGRRGGAAKSDWTWQIIGIDFTHRSAARGRGSGIDFGARLCGGGDIMRFLLFWPDAAERISRRVGRLGLTLLAVIYGGWQDAHAKIDRSMGDGGWAGRVGGGGTGVGG